MNYTQYETRESRLAIAARIAAVDCDEVTITEANIRCLMSFGKGIPAKALAALGQSWPPKHGWMKKAIGKKMKRSVFLSLLGKDIAGAVLGHAEPQPSQITCPCCGHSFSPSTIPNRAK